MLTLRLADCKLSNNRERERCQRTAQFDRSFIVVATLARRESYACHHPQPVPSSFTPTRMLLSFYMSLIPVTTYHLFTARKLRSSVIIIPSLPDLPAGLLLKIIKSLKHPWDQWPLLLQLRTTSSQINAQLVYFFSERNTARQSPWNCAIKGYT